MTKTQIEKNIVNDAIIKDISESIHGLKNGVVTITIQDAKIIQIEVTKKNVYDEVWTVESGGGI